MCNDGFLFKTFFISGVEGDTFLGRKKDRKGQEMERGGYRLKKRVNLKIEKKNYGTKIHH